MRARALAQPHAKRTGPVLEARGDLHWLEWWLPKTTSWTTSGRRRSATRPGGSRSPTCAGSAPPCPTPTSRSSTPAVGAWAETHGSPPAPGRSASARLSFTDGEDIWIGFDIGGERSASAVAWVNSDLHVGVGIYHGDDGVLECLEDVRELAGRLNIRELVFDPWRFGQAAQELSREGLTAVSFPQNDSRMTRPARRCTPQSSRNAAPCPTTGSFAGHAAAAIARHSRRGWRIDKPNARTNVDAVIALCMAVERAQHKPEPVEIVGLL
jgi:hypothetical protein